MLIRGRYVFKHVQCEYAIEVARDRTREQIMRKNRKPPALGHAGLDVLDEHRIEVCRTECLHFLLYDACAKCVSAADLENMLPPGEHLGYELITRKTEQ